jgi:hypothetical protein
MGQRGEKQMYKICDRIPLEKRDRDLLTWTERQPTRGGRAEEAPECHHGTAKATFLET